MLQKVIRIGNSVGVTLSKDFVDKYGVKVGSRISATRSNGSITFSSRVPKTSKYEAITDRVLAETILEVESRYGNALDELAKLE